MKKKNPSNKRKKNVCQSRFHVSVTMSLHIVYVNTNSSRKSEFIYGFPFKVRIETPDPHSITLAHYCNLQVYKPHRLSKKKCTNHIIDQKIWAFYQKEIESPGDLSHMPWMYKITKNPQIWRRTLPVGIISWIKYLFFFFFSWEAESSTLFPSSFAIPASEKNK